MNKLVKDALILTLITLVAGLALGGVELITREPIAKAEEETTRVAFESLFPDAKSFEAYKDFDFEKATEIAEKTVSEAVGSDWPTGAVTIDDCNEALDSSGSIMGKIVTVTNKKSYGGKITLSVGISSDNKLTGYMITDISDTPGLGMKATEDSFMSLFAGIDASILTVSKSEGGEGKIQAISGATITSKAVTNAVDAAVAYVNSLNGGETE